MRDDLGQRAPAPPEDAGHGPWSHLEMLVAELIDASRLIEHAVYRSQGGKGTRPDRYPRPGVDPVKKRTATGLSPAGITQLSALRNARQGARNV